MAGTGHDCFAHLIEQITLYCQSNRVRGDALEIALRLWTFVHGAASLQIDKDYLEIAPELDVNRLIANATPGLLAPAPRRSKGTGSDPAGPAGLTPGHACRFIGYGSVRIHCIGIVDAP